MNPAFPSVTAVFDNAGLIVPLPDLQEVLILGGLPPPGYSVFYPTPVLTLNDISGGQRSWTVNYPASFASNHGPMIRCGTDCIVLRVSQTYGAPTPGVDLFRINLGQ